MRKYVSKLRDKMTLKVLEAQTLLRKNDGENFVDTAIFS